MREQLNIDRGEAGQPRRREEWRGEMRRGGSQAAPAGGAERGYAFHDEACGRAEPAPKRRAKQPWILRLLAGLMLVCAALAGLIARYGRRNVPLAIGVFLFALLLLLAGYNAFFRQNQVARPVLFSTRADMPAGQSGSAARRPFVKQAITTEALSRGKTGRLSAAAAGAPGAPLKSDAASHHNAGNHHNAGDDAIGALIAAAEEPAARALPSAGALKKAPPPAAAGNHKAAVPRARPREGKAAAAPLRPQERAHILQLQRALQKSGARGLRATGAWDAASRAALRRFQGQNGLVMTGQADRQTIAKMRQLHLW